MTKEEKYPGFEFYGFALLCEAFKYRIMIDRWNEGFITAIEPETSTVGPLTFTVHYVVVKAPPKPTRKERGCFL